MGIESPSQTEGQGPRTSSSLLSGAGVMIAARLVVALFGWAGLLLIAAQLPTVEFGSYAFVFALLGLLGMVADFETTRVVMAEIDDWPNLDELAGKFVVFRVALSTTMYIVALSIVLLGNSTSVEVQAVALGGCSYFLGSALWSLITICQARMWLRVVAIAMVLGQMVQFGIVVFLAATDQGSLLRFVAPAVLNDAVALVALILMLRGVVRPRLSIDLRRWRHWFVSALPLATGSVIGQLYFKIDAVMLTWLLPHAEGRAAVARYQIGYKFSDLLAFLAPALLAAVLPELVRAKSRAAFRDTFGQALVIVVLIVAFVVPVFAVLAEPIIDAFVGADLVAAARPARWLVLGQALNFATQLVFITLVARDRRARYPIATATGLVVNVSLNVVLIPRYEVMGAAVATIVTEVVVIAMLVTALRKFGLRPLPFAALARVGLAATCSVAATFGAAKILPWVVAGFAGAGTYVAVLELTGVDGPGGLRGFARRSRERRRFPVTSPSTSQ